jgi:hypothetical protein
MCNRDLARIFGRSTTRLLTWTIRRQADFGPPREGDLSLPDSSNSLLQRDFQCCAGITVARSPVVQATRWKTRIALLAPLALLILYALSVWSAHAPSLPMSA